MSGAEFDAEMSTMIVSPPEKIKDLKFCEDCRHFFRSPYSGETCSRPTGKISLVTGRPIRLRLDAWDERNTDGETCGWTAKYFELKTNPPGFWKRVVERVSGLLDFER